MANMIRTIRIALARKAHAKAYAAHAAYQGQPAGNCWSVYVAIALACREEREAVKLARLLAA